MDETVEQYGHIEQIRFDRVFDVQGGDFSFESGGKKYYGVRFSNGSVPRDGALYAVALLEPGNWQKIVGWRDLSGASVELSESAWDVAFSQLGDFYLFIPIFIIAAFLFLGGWGALAAFGLFLWCSSYLVRKAARRNRLADQALRAVHPALPPDPGAGAPPTWRARMRAMLGLLPWN